MRIPALGFAARRRPALCVRALSVVAIALSFSEAMAQGPPTGDPEGKELWITVLNSESTDMAVVADLTGDGVRDAAVGGISDLVYCLDGYDGSFYWTARTSGTVWSVADIGDADWDSLTDIAAGTASNEVYLFSGGGALQGIAPWIWVAPTGGDVWDVASIGDANADGRPDVLAGTAGNKVLCLSGEDGEELWHYSTGGDVWSVDSAPDRDSDGVKEALAGTAGDKVLMIDGASGALRWSYATSGDVWKVISTPDLNGDGASDVLAGTAGDKVLAISGKYDTDSTRIWEFSTSGDVKALAVLGDVNGDGTHDVLAGSLDNNSYALDGATGAQLWAVTHLGEVKAVAAIADASRNGLPDAALGTASSRNRCLSGADGAVVWSYPFPMTDPCVAVATPGDIHGDGYDEVFSLTESGDVRCLSTQVLAVATGISRSVSLAIEATGQFYAGAFDYTAGVWTCTLDTTGQGAIRFLLDPSAWTGVYVYDYDQASWQTGLSLYLQTI